MNLGWTPAMVGALTLYQLKIYTTDPGELGGKKTMTVAEYNDWERQRRGPAGVVVPRQPG